MIAPGIDVHPFVSADNVTLARLRAADRCMERPIGNKYTVDIRHGLLTGQIHACQVAGYDAVPAADADAVASVAAGNVALSNRACTDVPVPADLAVIAAYLNSGQREVIDLQTHYGEMRSLHFYSIAFLLIGAVQNHASVACVYRYIRSRHNRQRRLQPDGSRLVHREYGRVKGDNGAFPEVRQASPQRAFPAVFRACDDKRNRLLRRSGVVRCEERNRLVAIGECERCRGCSLRTAFRRFAARIHAKTADAVRNDKRIPVHGAVVSIAQRFYLSDLSRVGKVRNVHHFNTVAKICQISRGAVQMDIHHTTRYFEFR
ncbi:hypothetical protein SDC9_105361 [bioreactor metagenome]|uniref:Uncharacterized protein n=1 Tax=bioreactor metagenome TaxID=1076179 RepID=A0A645AZB6_9ZZZZ